MGNHRITTRDRRPALPPDHPPAAHPDQDFNIDGGFPNGPASSSPFSRAGRAMHADGGQRNTPAACSEEALQRYLESIRW
jgi:hypothetical protein